ncbi:calcium/sodium antiporter [Marinobacterium sediminicola]|uniref:Cation:H+ antiporter n=1 Tax=Marinobacterium sediminicola TaxID=518898 RepID=A0ABY1RYX8_9GAMM|nr:calcium/sodium antiporter [Marinobacterium sediminicola]ULG68014.1 calcium/sodium antiporter [Marinobacterium sediminicola]SMR73476.1 cation:H+ antiporter [Marinobacterium sediminicola]
MLMAILAVVGGLALLVWSADRFIDGAAATARHAGMPPLLIGMVIIGFGTSAPEMVVSAFASLQGNPNLALGNGYGSNITNIALILGITALLSPIAVHSQILRKELPLLAVITLLAGYQLMDGQITATEAWTLLGVFFLMMGWSIVQGMRQRGDTLGSDVEHELASDVIMPLGKALIWLLIGLILLIASSRILVWGAVDIASAMGVSDLIIGLTVVAIGTSLPELASSIIAVRKNEHDLALGNVIGSNMFNTLAVVGIAGAIHPMSVSPEVLTRDWVVMAGLTLSLFVLGYGFRGQSRINRAEGGLLLAIFVAYTGYLVYGVVNA